MMNDKVTLQAISDLFASQFGISKKTTDAFGKSFFDTIVDGLNQDGQVKIKGLGTFKIVSVGSRESVNVTNGERIVIEGYKKVSFTPDEIVEQKKNEIVEEVESQVEEAAASVETVDVEDEKPAIQVEEETPTIEVEDEKPAIEVEEDVKEQIETALQQTEEAATEEVQSLLANDEVQPETIETPKDDLSGIDLLISTPESVEDLKKDLEQAKIRAEETLEQAKSANIAYRRLQLLLERLENNQAPETLVKEMAVAAVAASAAPIDEPIATEPIPEPIPEPEAEPAPEPLPESEAEPAPTPTPSPSPTPAPKTLSSREQAIQRYLDDDDDDDDDDEEEGHSRRWLYIVLAVALLLLGGIAYYLYSNSKPKYIYDMSEEEDTLVVVPKDTAIAKSDTIAKDSVKLNGESFADAEKEIAEAERVKAKQEADAKAAEKIEADKKAAEAKRPRTHVMAKGESLTRISQRYYGTKDSVNAIIRFNNFKDPNNVPYGAVVKLP